MQAQPTMVLTAPIQSQRRRKPLWAASLAVLALLPSLGLAWQYRDLPHFGRYNDDGIYLVSARSLAEGSGYRILSLPGEPYQTKYPPLYPAYLSTAWKVNSEFPANLPVVMALSWTLLPIFIVLARHVYRDLGYGWTASWLLAAILAVNPYSVMFAVSPLSELFACSLLLASLAVARQPKWALWSGTLAGLAFLAKTAFISLLLAIPAYYVLKRNSRAAVWSLAGGLPFLAGWMWWSRSHRALPAPATLWYTDYLGFYLENFSLEEFPALLSTNLNVLFWAIGAVFFYGSEGTGLPLHIFRVLAFACTFGIIRQARRGGLHPFHVFAVAYLPVLLAWNYAPHERFTYPLFALLLAGFATELTHVAALARSAYGKPGIGQRVAGVVFGLILAAILALGARGVWRAVYQDLPAVFSGDRAFRPTMVKAYRWIAANVPEGAAFLAYDDPSLYLYTGRHACGMHAPTREQGGKSTLEYFSSMPGLARRSEYDYVFLTGSDFLQDMRKQDRIDARLAIDRDKRTVTLYEDGKIAVRRVLR